MAICCRFALSLLLYCLTARVSRRFFLNSQAVGVLRRAFDQFRAGDLVQAKVGFESVLRAEPRNVDALNMLGMLAQQQGRSVDALEFLSRAVAVKPHYGIYLNIGNIQALLGHPERAAAAYGMAIGLKQDFAPAHAQLGALMRTVGRLEDALAHFRKAVTLAPGVSDGHLQVANVLHLLGRLEDAVTSCRVAVTLSPNNGAAHTYLGMCLSDLGQTSEATPHLDMALYLAPNDPELHYRIALLKSHQGEFIEAFALLEKSIQLSPEFMAPRIDYVAALTHLGRFDEAIAQSNWLLERVPDSAAALCNLGNVHKALGNVNEAVSCFKRCVLLDPGFLPARTNLLLALNYAQGFSPEEIFAEHIEFERAHVQGAFCPHHAHPNSTSLPRRLKVGYVSPDFRKHAVAYFIEPLLMRCDRARFEIFCYSNNPIDDEVTERLKGYCEHWREISRLDDARATELIRTDGIDILVDLAGHTKGNRLLVFARKPAPVQLTWLGYPHSTGLSAMDYRLTDSYAEPIGLTEHLNRETLYRLPEVFACYTPCAAAPERASSTDLEPVPSPVLANGYITFGCFNTYAKVTPAVIALWSRVLAAVPSSKLLLESAGLGGVDMQERVRLSFVAHGVEGDRLILMERSPAQQYVLYHKVDIALDPFPCNGGTTTYDALWMGVPLITLAGTTFVSRMGVSYLSNLGLLDLIAQTPDQYVEIARRISADTEKLNTLRLGLRDLMESSALMDQDRFARNLDAAYLAMWSKWCSQSEYARICSA